jgi:hypothetical protein
VCQPLAKDEPEITGKQNLKNLRKDKTMTKRTNQPLEDLQSLKDMAESCDFMLGDDGHDMLEGEIESCPTPIEAELRLLIGKHPNITTVADASLVVAEVGTKVIVNMVQYHMQEESTPFITDEVLGLEKVLAGGEHFQVLPLFPTCKVAYRQCCACFIELQVMQDSLSLPLEDVVKMVLVAGLAHAAEWIPKARRGIFRRELHRFHDWLVLTLESPHIEAAQVH